MAADQTQRQQRSSEFSVGVAKARCRPRKSLCLLCYLLFKDYTVRISENYRLRMEQGLVNAVGNSEQVEAKAAEDSRTPRRRCAIRSAS